MIQPAWSSYPDTESVIPSFLEAIASAETTVSSWSPGPGLVYREPPTVEIGAVELLNRAHGILIIDHLNETETTTLVRFAIDEHLRGSYLSISLEE